LELRIKINQKERLAYIPKALFQILGTNVRAAPNRAAVLLFSDKTTIDEALRSLEIIKADLQHARALERTGYCMKHKTDRLSTDETCAHLTHKPKETST
jgi:hypothetical protein